jgi:hypothetical protein
VFLLPFLRSSATADEGTRRPSVPGADVAQLVEQLTRNEQVVRSSRIVGSISSLENRKLPRGVAAACAAVT